MILGYGFIDWFDKKQLVSAASENLQGNNVLKSNYGKAVAENAARERGRRWWSEFGYSGALSMSEREVKDLADYFAAELAALRVDIVDMGTGFNNFKELLFPEQKTQKSKIQLVKKINIFNFSCYSKRLCCKRWWKSQIRRWVVRSYEAWAIDFGKVGAAAGSWYCSDRALTWRVNQLSESEAMMKATIIENQSGERMTLFDVAQKTTANKSNRRDELMTRIRGCEEWADANSLVCMFTTNTCPSRFHAQRMGGGVNKKYDGSTPDIAQDWLNATWARCRAQLHREGLHVMGFRVAEPHHDGCPHWHMMLFVKPCDYEAVSAALRGHWLREPEQGSEANRLKIVKIDKCKGTAAGYIAKYIAKNIDDHEISHHRDDDFTDGVIEKEDHPARRVDAWAACWRIRQFQAIGQPPVTVWRELRRTTREAAAGGSDTLIKAWLSVHRTGERMACWNSYMQAQGGAMCKRKDYKLCSYAIDKTVNGRYGEAVQAWTCGVRERALGEGFVTPTKRQSWGGEGFAVFKGEAAWTRLNNCTRAKNANRKNLGVASFDESKTRGNPLDDWEIDPAKAAQADDFWASQTFNCHK